MKVLILLAFCFSALAADNYVKLPPDASGGGGAVNSVNGNTGNVVLTKSSLGLGNVDNTSDANKPVSTAQQTALNLKADLVSAQIDITNRLLKTSGAINAYDWENGEFIGGHIFNDDLTIEGTFRTEGQQEIVAVLSGNGGGNWLTHNYEYIPTGNHPGGGWNINNILINLDPTVTGFAMGTSGQAVVHENTSFYHHGSGSIGYSAYKRISLDIGNGTDPISMNGFDAYVFGGTINSGVTITNQITPYRNDLNIQAGATISTVLQPFADAANIQVATEQYNSAQFSPTILAVKNNFNYCNMCSAPQIGTLQGNAGATGYSWTPTITQANNGGIDGVYINPTVTSGANINYNAGYFSSANVNTTGSKYAGYFEGNVNVTGSLTFGGALSIGQLNAFANYTVIDGGGNPSSVNSLISNMTVSGAAIANADTFGINTAALITMQPGSSFTSGGLGIGLAALGLPAVVETHTGSSGDYIGGALFAISLSGTSTGGTINQLYGGRWLAIPNGITTVNRHYNGWFQNPFGNPATDNWGIYQEDSEKNYFEGTVMIGDSDSPSNNSVALEIDSITKAFVPSRMTTAQRNAMSAIPGMIIFNLTTNKHQGYDGTIWNDFY